MNTQTETKIKCSCGKILAFNLEKFRLMNKVWLVVKAREVKLLCPCGQENTIEIAQN